MWSKKGLSTKYLFLGPIDSHTCQWGGWKCPENSGFLFTNGTISASFGSILPLANCYQGSKTIAVVFFEPPTQIWEQVSLEITGSCIIRVSWNARFFVGQGMPLKSWDFQLYDFHNFRKKSDGLGKIVVCQGRSSPCIGESSSHL